jgi:oxalate decarboxylase/phosphoglucose isomerase-like protein (cupin superfamily)
VIIHDLSPEAVSKMTQVDLSKVERRPGSPIGEFAFHDCRYGIGSFVGCPHWERHNGGDELLLVLAGVSNLTVLEEDGPVTTSVGPGSLVVVPRGCWHSNDAPEGVTMLYITPREGNEHRLDAPDAS